MGVSIGRRGELEVLLIDNDLALAEISLLGGQVLSWTPKDEHYYDRLWVSPLAVWDKSKPVRGGIPVCWPWFGQHRDASLPSHGFVRTQSWRLLETTEKESGTEVILQPAFTVGRGLEQESQLTLTVRAGRELTLILTTRNTGLSAIPLSCALHTYFRVSDVCEVELQGLNGSYSDKTRDWALLATPGPYRFSEETDRIHLVAAPRVEIVDPGAPGNTCVTSSGHDSIVVWNPWRERAQALGDMAAEDHRHMLCVETALTQDFELLPGQVHYLTQTVGVAEDSVTR